MVARSMRSVATMPTTSDMRLPSPAAQSVESASACPTELSMWSPAAIMMILSTKPKAMNGMPTFAASSMYWGPSEMDEEEEEEEAEAEAEEDAAAT